MQTKPLLQILDLTNQKNIIEDIMKKKEKIPSASIKIDVEIFKTLKKYCDDNGIKVGHFTGKAIEEKLNSLLVETN